MLGVVLGLGGTLWGTIDAAATARRTNELQREAVLSRVSVGPVRGPEGTAVRIGMTLPVNW